MRLATRMRDIEPFHVMEILGRVRELEAQGRDIVHMEIGEPDFATPQPVIAAAQEALAAGKTFYTPAQGLLELREAIAGFYQERYSVSIPASRIFVTPGASGALLLALGVLLNAGDEVLMADPGYPCNRHFARFLHGCARTVAVGPDSAYQLTSRHVETHWGERTAVAMIASPSNPTGTVLEPDALRDMAVAVSQRNGALLVDEIYHGLVYDADVPTALSITDEAFVINSFSKYFCMTGWRLGWLIVPEAYCRTVEKLVQNIFIAASTPAQYAALAAFEPETLAILEQRRAIFRERRDFLLPALRELGFKIPVEPRGAFYLYANSSGFAGDSFSLAAELLEQVGVAVTPGIDFGHNQPESHLRFAYTTSRERLEEGVERLRKFLA